MVEVPMIKLFEQAICDRYYAVHSDLVTAVTGPVEERLCKIPAIQNELAALVGWKFTFDALPGRLRFFKLMGNDSLIRESGLLTALFYGSIADR